tara:strand:- start:163 stop:498 length:336 start_codon:yes stop_codon:yes gene_type:complete
MKIRKSQLKLIVEEVMSEVSKANRSVPAWMISGKSNVEVGFHNGVKALQKVTGQMEKEGFGDKGLHKKIQQKLKELTKLGEQIGYVKTGKEGPLKFGKQQTTADKLGGMGN